MQKIYSEYIMKKIRQYNDLKEDDRSRDEEFYLLSPSEVFEMVCYWEGLHGWDSTIKMWIDSIYGIKLD